jgi:hypothetical protein
MDDDEYECGAAGGMLGRGNQSTWRKPAPVPLCSPQISYNLDSNLGHRCGKPAINCLSYGTAMTTYLTVCTNCTGSVILPSSVLILDKVALQLVLRVLT